MTIEIMKIFKESFRHVQEHKLEWLRVAYAPLVIWLIGVVFLGIGYLSLGIESMDNLTLYLQGNLALSDQPFLLIFANILHNITYFIAYFCIYINGYRYAVFGEGGDRWWTLNLNWRFVKLFLYTLLLGVLAVIYVGVTGGIAAGAYFLTESTVLTAILGVLFGIYGFYLLIRIGLTYLLISIDQENPLRVGWRLLKGNVLHVLGLLLLISLVILLIFIVGSLVLGIFGWILSLMSLWLIAIPIILFFLFGLAMWLLIWAVTSKALALVYKTFTSGTAF